MSAATSVGQKNSESWLVSDNESPGCTMPQMDTFGNSKLGGGVAGQEPRTSFPRIRNLDSAVQEAARAISAFGANSDCREPKLLLRRLRTTNGRGSCKSGRRRTGGHASRLPREGVRLLLCDGPGGDRRRSPQSGRRIKEVFRDPFSEPTHGRLELRIDGHPLVRRIPRVAGPGRLRHLG